MSHSTVAVLFIVLVGIYTTHGNGENYCERTTGICFGTNFDLFPYNKCNVLAEPPFNYGCPIEDNTCCINCATINKTCNDRFYGSVGRSYCCPGELQVYRPYPLHETPCCCCQYCDPNRRCLKERGPKGDKKKGFCITRNATDYDYTYEYCVKDLGWKVKWDWCEGDGCGCCHSPRK